MVSVCLYGHPPLCAIVLACKRGEKKGIHYTVFLQRRLCSRSRARNAQRDFHEPMLGMILREYHQRLLCAALLAAAIIMSAIQPGIISSLSFVRIGIGFCRTASDPSEWTGIYRWSCLDLEGCKSSCASQIECVGVSHSNTPPAGASECARAGKPRCVTYFGAQVAQGGRHLGGPHALQYVCYRK